MLDIPIYGGGLGVLAGDTMKSLADMNFSVSGLGILWNKGYFKQNFWYKHGQVPGLFSPITKCIFVLIKQLRHTLGYPCVRMDAVGDRFDLVFIIRKLQMHHFTMLLGDGIHFFASI